jgi:hypothetical protein
MSRMSGRLNRARLLVVLPVIVLVLLGACASAGGGIHEERRVADEALDPADAPTQVVVNNRSWESFSVTPGGGIPTWTIEQAAGLSSVSFR